MVNERLEPTLKWCEENKERINAQPYKWYCNNRLNVNRYHREYRKKSVKNLLTDRVRHLINYSLKRRNIEKTRHLEVILDYSIEQLKKRLRQTMPKGYTWADFLKGKLDIDHIKPILSFDYNSQDDPEFKRCWALNNLRLLTIYDNRSRKKVRTFLKG